MKKALQIFTLVFISHTGFAQGISGMAPSSMPGDKVTRDTSYTVTSADKKVKGEFKDIIINLASNPVKGMMSLELSTDRSCKLMIELKNGDEDVLLFEPIELKKGNNIIPFETDDASVTSFRLKLSEVHNSDSFASFLIKKKGVEEVEEEE